MTKNVATLPDDHPINQLPKAAMKDPSQFSAKLTFEERCSILALSRANFSNAVIAAAYKINRRTITHLLKGFHGYKRILEEEKMLGPDDFQRKYLTEVAAEKIRLAIPTAEASQTYTEYDATPGDRAGVPNKRATTAAGITVLTPRGAEYTHRIEITWLEANVAQDANGPFDHPAGWYWRDLDGEDQYWNGDPDGQTHFTSARTLSHARRVLGA